MSVFNGKVFDLFVEKKMTMREGLIRVLEKEIDTTVLKREEGMASFKQDDVEASIATESHL